MQERSLNVTALSAGAVRLSVAHARTGATVAVGITGGRGKHRRLWQRYGPGAGRVGDGGGYHKAIEATTTAAQSYLNSPVSTDSQ